jgi:hypothetical protein
MSTTFHFHTTESNNVVATVRAAISRVAAFLSGDTDHRERAYEEAYLAESTDRYDLEFRMRELSRANPQPSWMAGAGR